MAYEPVAQPLAITLDDAGQLRAVRFYKRTVVMPASYVANGHPIDLSGTVSRIVAVLPARGYTTATGVPDGRTYAPLETGGDVFSAGKFRMMAQTPRAAFTPAGTVSAPTFTGSAMGTHSHGTTTDANVLKATGAVSNVTADDVGTLATDADFIKSPLTVSNVSNMVQAGGVANVTALTDVGNPSFAGDALSTHLHTGPSHQHNYDKPNNGNTSSVESGSLEAGAGNSHNHGYTLAFTATGTSASGTANTGSTSGGTPSGAVTQGTKSTDATVLKGSTPANVANLVQAGSITKGTVVTDVPVTPVTNLIQASTPSKVTAVTGVNAVGAGTPAGTNSAPTFTGTLVAASAAAEVAAGTNLSATTVEYVVLGVPA